jgi:hypothetical protein
MVIRYIDSDDDKIFTLGNEEKHVIHNAKDIKIIFNSNEIRNNSPFSVKITETLTPANIMMITIIIIVAFVGFIIFIFSYIYIRNKRRNMAIIINNNIDRNCIIESNGFNSERNGLTNYVDHLKTVKYKDVKDKSINKNCPIELAPFEDNSDVVFTSCHHSFHYNCLKEHIYRNIGLKEVQCFYCKKILFKPKNNSNSSTDLKSSPP